MIEVKKESENPLRDKDFDRMLNMKNIESIIDYLYEITMSQDKKEAYETLKSYLAFSTSNKYNLIAKAVLQVLKDSFGVNDLKDLYRSSI